jgi:hypothetical protein
MTIYTAIEMAREAGFNDHHGWDENVANRSAKRWGGTQSMMDTFPTRRNAFVFPAAIAAEWKEQKHGEGPASRGIRGSKLASLHRPSRGRKNSKGIFR